jgi:hypothetical protein
VIDDGTPSLREQFGAATYELLVLDPKGQAVPGRRDWELPPDEAELAALIRRLLAAGPPPSPADAVADAVGGPADGVARPDAGRAGGGDPDGGAPRDALADTVARPDAPSPPDAGPPADAGDRDAAPLPDGPRDAAVLPDAAPDVPAPRDVPGDPLVDFALPDRNPRSPWYGQELGPAELRGAVYFLYFASAG